MKLAKLLFLLPVSLFSFEINFSKKFSQEFNHDVLNAYLTVSITDKTETNVNNRLEVFNNKIKSYNKVEKKLGTFDIRPKYKHSNNTPKVSGYIGVLRYKVSSNKAMFMNELISDISGMKKNRDTSVSLYNLKWGVKDETYSIGMDLLRLDAISWVQNYVNVLSQDINKECNVKKIEINSYSSPISMRANMSAITKSSDSNSIPVPVLNKERLTINPEYTLECK